ncbi:MAG TPA: TonB-dependent receptor [Flavipsychrobacter sp.]|nr:TonB-dependent receptor [Flavipsychrobacter sp.]
MQKITLLIGLMTTCFLPSALAQQYKLEGDVKNEKREPIPGASIILLKQSDSSLIRIALADSNGHYTTEALPADKYLVKPEAVGYAALAIPLTIIANTTQDFTLIPTGNALNEVVVSSKKPFLESSFGKTTLNLNNTTIAAGSSALDLLKKSPGVRVDAGGNVLLNGTNVLVLVDEKQTYLSGKDLEEYLKSLSADQLVQIELMTQPSAKYDKEGSGGIINLKTKSIRKNGLNGNYSSSVEWAQRVHPAVRSNLNLNYSHNDLRLFANAAYVHVQSFMDEKTSRIIKDTQQHLAATLDQAGFYKETWEDYSLQLGADYKFSPKVKAGAMVKAVYHPNKEKDLLRTSFAEANGNTAIHHTERDFIYFKNSAAANVYLVCTPHENESLVVNADYIYRDHNVDTKFRSAGYDINGQPTGDDLVLHSDAPFITELFAAKADYDKTIGKDARLEAGMKSSFVTIDNGSYFRQLINDEWQYDTLRTNSLLYKENIHAAYAGLNKKLAGKWEAQLGLRIEHTRLQGIQRIGLQSFSRNFTSIFPSAFIGYKPNESHGFELNCGRRIERPNYKQLNPFIQYTSPYQYETGNPLLLPSYSYNIELKYNYRNTLFSTLELRRRDNVINPVILQDAAAQTTIFTSANNARKNVVHVSEYLTKQLFSWWNFAASADMYYQAYKLNGQHSTYSQSVGCSLSAQNTLTLAKSWTLDTAYYWSTGDLQSMIERNKPTQWLSLSVAKKLMKDTATLKLSFEDPLNAYQQTMVSNWNGVETTADYKYLSQQVSLGFTYNFGRQKENTERNNNALEETKRM